MINFQENKSQTRRTIDEDNSAGFEEDGDLEDVIELRSNHRSKKRLGSKKKSKSKRSKSKRKVKTRSHNALRQAETDKVKKELKAKCISEIGYKVTKCIQACHRTHEDVCTRLACSVRSRRELRKECDNSCRQTFVATDC